MNTESSFTFKIAIDTVCKVHESKTQMEFYWCISFVVFMKSNHIQNENALATFGHQGVLASFISRQVQFSILVPESTVMM